MVSRGAKAGGLMAGLRRRAAAAAAAAAAQLEVASATAAAAQLQVDAAPLPHMRQTLRELLEFPPVEDTPPDSDVRAEALRQGTRAADAARELAAAVATCVHGQSVRIEGADVLMKRAAVAAAAAAEATAGRSARAVPPERALPAASQTPTESQQAGTRKRGPRRCSLCRETGHHYTAHCTACGVLGHKRDDCEASAAEEAAHTARVKARKAETTAARAKAAAGVPRASSHEPPQCRASRATGHTSGSRACPKNQRPVSAATAYTGDSGVSASAPDPDAIGKQRVYASTLVPLRVLFDRHHVQRGWRPRRKVAGGRPPIWARFVKRDAGASAASARLQHELERLPRPAQITGCLS